MRIIYRIASFLLVMVMVTFTYAGSTVAKYVIDSEADDASRVTRFGVTTGVQAGAFATSYKNQGGTVTVKSDTRVVAPGTEGTFSGIHITGVPEVNVRVTTTADLELTNWTTTGSDYYCPLRITVNGTEYYGMNYGSMDEFEADVEGAITTVNGNTYSVGTNLANQSALNGDYSWRWDYKGTDGKQTTEKDTALGDRAAANINNAGTVSLVVTARVDQID